MMRDQPPVPMVYPGQQGGVPAYPVHHHPYGYGPYAEPAQDEDGFDPLKLLWFAVHYRWMIASFLFVGVVCGVLFTFMQTPYYKASTKVEILTQGARVIEDLEVVSQRNDSFAFETARQKMLSRDLARRVVFALNLTEDPEFLAPKPSFSLMNIFHKAFGTSSSNNVADWSPERRESIAVNLVRQGASATPVRGTSLINLEYHHPVAKYTSLVANQLAKSYIDQNIDQKSETTTLARQFIEDQVRETKIQLQDSEKALVQYAQQNGITLTGDDASLVSGNISEINSALSEAIQERLAAERYFQQIEDGNAAALPEVFSSPSIQANKEAISGLRATYMEKLATLKPGYPEMQRLQAQINELQKQMNAEILAIADSVKLKYEQSKQKEAALKKELAGLEAEQSKFQEKNIQYTILKREVDSNRAQYESLISKLGDVGIGSDLRSANASIVDLALTPGSPYSPQLSKNLIIAFGLFGLFAVATIYVLELLNNTFTIPDQLEDELKVPVLGTIPQVPESEISEAFQNPASQLSEAYRTLRTSVQFTGTDESIRTLVVTSAEPSEGKTTTAFKLAEDFASLGRRVLLIDADMRKPRLHRMFNTDNGIGLSNLLSNVVKSGTAMDIFRKTRNPNVTFLSAGTIPPNPADLLVSQKMGLTIHYCKKRYDLVIIDSPPVMGLSDAPILARQADATLMVVSAKQVTRKAAKAALNRLKSAGANVVGSTLTKFTINKLDYNYAHRYMHYNYYSYAGAENARLEHHGRDDEETNFDVARSTTAVGDFFSRIARRFS
ncbi:polysaccharide biosynthesis tyrosine autokinase [Hoeflea sp. WL0058]|uniref:non-specific protein-tyrosine kinase n=1 Tax=Flavimaribacter sediminis TaxID=2865987 RepID=A0AAE2ZK74_9HYPH|nr:polysaccharide biosynthesis tyrosine autokinase [Flavimaribacter sediminis]MBW8636192.1 polysaccharide biosynthesis tyrosine autokinase [Flavimaribacter sediminis]